MTTITPVGEKGLGRVHVPDLNDLNYLTRAIKPTRSQRTTRYWYANNWWGDQGAWPHCVDFAWHHFIADGPVTHPDARGPLWTPGEVYHKAQRVDEWEGEGYDGTSVRAGAKVLQEMGYISEYRWALTLDDMLTMVLDVAPVVVGTNWYEGMSRPSIRGLIKVEGDVEGGHAYLVNGVNVSRRLFRVKNSWGRGWGANGFAFVSFEDMERLIDEDGEVCLAREIRRNV